MHGSSPKVHPASGDARATGRSSWQVSYNNRFKKPGEWPELQLDEAMILASAHRRNARAGLPTVDNLTVLKAWSQIATSEPCPYPTAAKNTKMNLDNLFKIRISSPFGVYLEDLTTDYWLGIIDQASQSYGAAKTPSLMGMQLLFEPASLARISHGH